MERLHHPGTLAEIRGNALAKNQAGGHSQRFCKTIESPIGPIALIANAHALVGLHWGKNLAEFVRDRRTAHGESIGQGEIDSSILTVAARQLNEYFSGERIAFDIPLAPTGSEFQMRVWQELLQIPYGTCITYGEQARRLGRPKAARAVGGANGKNPIGIIVPCHRVIGASGCLTGFAGGLEIKKQLLAIEGMHVTK